MYEPGGMWMSGYFTLIVLSKYSKVRLVTYFYCIVYLLGVFFEPRYLLRTYWSILEYIFSIFKYRMNRLKSRNLFKLDGRNPPR